MSTVVVLTIGLAARWAAAATGFHAEPEVQVIDAPPDGASSGAILLRNDTASTVVVGRITAEPGCDAAFVHAPTAGFMLAAGATHSLPITCSPAPASMQRCQYRARSPAGDALLAFEAVCAHAGSTALTPDTGAVDFGAVQIGSPVSRTIALRNAGGVAFDKLFIETTDLAGNFAVAAPCNPNARECDAAIPVVGPDGTTTAVVTCTPRVAETIAAVLHIATSAGTRAPPISLACTGQPASAPVIAVAPSAVKVGAVETVGGTATATVRIANAGTGMLILSDVQLVDGGAGGAADWRTTASSPCSATIPPSCALGPGESIDLELVFDPSAIGVRDAILLIAYRDTADRTTSIPLHGIGRGATLELIGRHTVLDFGALPLDTQAALTFQVANRGTRDLADGTVALTPVGPPFTVTPAPEFGILVSAPTTFTVTCQPTASGSFTARLQLTAADTANAPIELTLRCTGDPATVLTATPPAVLLGEVRRSAPQIVRQVGLAGGSVMLASATLETARPGMTVRGAPGPLPATIELAVSSPSEGDLANLIIATPSMGPARAIAVTGTAVAATYSVPALVSLGTFCVQQPTTPRIIQLTSIGTATIGIEAPVLQRSDSPFDLELIAPLAYPSALAPGQRVVVAATPKRRATAGFLTDDVIWQTDVAGATSPHTRLTATFVDAGPAIAPDMLTFGGAPIHVDTRNAQQVTLQNCDVSALQLEAPQIDAPFSIDSPPPPNLLRPGQTVTFSVGFHPTKLGDVSKTLTITSPQLRSALTVALTGTGISANDGPTTGSGGPLGLDDTSFYACSSCASGDAASALAIAVVLAAVIAPRRRRARVR